MIRVRVPLDLHAVTQDGASAFALATPLRVRDLLKLTVREAIGPRAPHEKFQRNVRQTLDGFLHGDFMLTIDGRLLTNMDDVVVCSGEVCVRFFNIPAVPASFETPASGLLRMTKLES